MTDYAKMLNERLPRRSFIKRAAAIAAPLIVPASVLGRDARRPAPSNRITVGCIGLGGMGTNNMQSFLHQERTQVVAVCDVDANHLASAKKIVEDYYAQQAQGGTYKGCTAFHDFRDLIARPDIDALSIAVPDHWHAIPVIMGAKAGKDMYCEKPLSLTVEQGRIMSDTVRRYGTVFQTGSQLRSFQHVRWGIDAVRKGKIGQVKTIYAVCHSAPSLPPQPEMPVPQGFDYDFWLGPAPYAPYFEGRCHGSFRWNHDYSGGQPTDHGAHYCDLAQLGLGMELSGPTEVEGKGDFPQEGPYNAAMTYRIEATYANGVKLICTNASGKDAGIGGGTTFYGTEGMLYAGDGDLKTDPPSIMNDFRRTQKLDVYESPEHHGNFLDCVKTRGETFAPIEQAHRSVTIGHIGNIAMKLGRKLRWNPDTERFVNDPEADRMLSRAMGAPWSLNM